MFRRSKTDRREPDTLRQAREAAEQAIRERHEVEAQAPAARAIGSELRDALDRNHFGEAIERSLLRRDSS